MDSKAVDMYLYRHVAAAWDPCIRPWLEAAARFPGRSWVVVPSRGQAQAWKQRCVETGLALLGVEFLTPGLARQKWFTPGSFAPALGRELLLFGLGRLVDQRLAEEIDDAERALLLSLRTDLERALDDFDALLRAGFGPQAFPWPPLVTLFERLETWVVGLGYGMAPRQAIEAAAQQTPTTTVPLPDARCLVLGFGPESWGEFPNVLALVRRCGSATIVIPEPEMRGGRDADERWIEVWERALGATALPLDVDEPSNCGSAVVGWLPSADDDVRVDWERVSVRVAQTRKDEAAFIAEGVRRWLSDGAQAIAVVFPRADGVFLDVRAQLEAAGIPFRDEIGAPGLVSTELELQRGLLRFWADGGRWPNLLEFWPTIVRLGATTLAPHHLRKASQRWFDETQSLAVVDARTLIETGKGPAALALAKLLPKLQLVWPTTLTLAETLDRLQKAWDEWETGLPKGWEVMRGYAAKDTTLAEPKQWLMLALAFLAEPGAERKPKGLASFARVVLTTRRRAEGAPWTHVWLAEANAGQWPERVESSCWLPDEARKELAAQSPHGICVLTADERAWLEKGSYARLARDASEQLVLSASLLDASDAEADLAPNAWLERLLWASPGRKEGANLEAAFRATSRAAQLPPQPAPAADLPGAASRGSVFRGRRDQRYPFDEYMLVLREPSLTPRSAAARVVEATMEDPAVLWFEEVLKAVPVGWEPLQRARRKWIGQLSHEVVANALRGEPVGGPFQRVPALDEALRRMRADVGARRGAAPADAYWDSCYAELEGVCARLLARALTIPDLPGFVAVEFSLPDAAWVPLATEGERLGLRGRIDAAFVDQPDWAGARVEIVDFKTGTEGALTAEAMARGRSLQLGLYLSAMRNLGARTGGVWMVRPGHLPPKRVAMEQLHEALSGLARIEAHLKTGIYGALTPERSEYSFGGYQWPLACTTVPLDVLKAKFELAFGGDDEVQGEGATDA